MKDVLVIGHRNPDSDSICSAIGYAYLKNQLGEPAIAARAGALNAETQYILECFREPWPILIDDFYPRARDVMFESPESIGEDDTLWQLGRVMSQAGLKSVPVLDENRHLLGVVSIGDLAKHFFDELVSLNFSQTGTKFSAVAQVLSAEVLAGQELLSKTLEGRLKIAGSSLKVIQKAFAKGDIAVVGDREDVHELLVELQVSAIILTSSSEVDPEIIQRATQENIIILRCSHDTYTCARLLNQSLPVKSIMQKEVISFSPDDLLEEVKEKITQTRFRNYPVVKKGKFLGMISRSALILREPQKVILVDHNERSQAVEGIEYTKIVEIVDHHRLGGLQTNEPIFIRQEPVGCTATIIANMFWHREIEIPENIAGILLSAILSDTVLFKSPTCTEKDRVTAEKLAVISKLDAQQHGMNLLKAGANLSRQTPSEILHQDLKEFQLGKYRISVSQVYVMDLEELKQCKLDLEKELKILQEKENYDFSLLMVTDIIQENTELLVSGSHQFLIEHAFETTADHGIYHLPGVMSRKKQLIPPLGAAVQELS